MKRRSKAISKQDREAFREATEGVRPLAHDKVAPYRAPPPPRALQRELDEHRVLADMFSDVLDAEELESGEELSYLRTGMQHQVLRKLRRGHYSVGAELDLHGYTVAEARQALSGFLQQAQDAGIRCVRVIHGKGNQSLDKRPILKGKVDYWLRQWNDVLAFTSARPVDGGTGALYVLLKSRRGR